MTVAMLSPRERQVLRALLAGNSGKQVAVDLGTTPSAVSYCRHQIYSKLGVRNDIELGAFAERHGIREQLEAGHA